MFFGDQFWKVGTQSKLSREYLLLAVLYGGSTLIIPLATQYLVNNLALSSLFSNTLVFLILILGFLTFSQILRFIQLIILEHIQREIFVAESRKWMMKLAPKKAHYLLEVQSMMKSFSISWGNLVELGLTLFFGLIVIILLHPAFLIVPVLIGAGAWGIFGMWKPAILTSVEESNEKYRIVDLGQKDKREDVTLASFLEARDRHFTYIKRSTVIVGLVLVLTQVYLLSLGIWLIGADQLSLGQLISAEIILSGIMAAFVKLPKTMESIYDLETSEIKLGMAAGDEA